ncbi:MAG TPA: pyridoxamine 5'-phosphate oxidase family protein [Nocardioides sp.]|uniref:pyridoxamine 5'-phosphate oxidase family protein n=1 Tax=Nocardioides sp. TaxID=35761 RepID=UPI002F41AAF1
MTDPRRSPRRPVRLPEKASTERADLDALLDSARVGHFALVAEDGTPAVIPTMVVRDGDRVLAHGSTGSRWMRRLAEGAPTALAVTAYDGVVVARSAFESSIRYRSAVVFGRCSTLTEDKERFLDLVTDALIPGRRAEIRRPTRAELAATLVLGLPIEDWSLKVSAGWPEDTEDDLAGPAWAGVVPLRQAYDEPLPAPDLREGIEVPASVRSLGNRSGPNVDPTASRPSPR